MSNNTEIDSFIEHFKDQLKLTCRIHKCDIHHMNNSLWGVTLNAALNMGRISKAKEESVGEAPTVNNP